MTAPCGAILGFFLGVLFGLVWWFYVAQCPTSAPRPYFRQQKTRARRVKWLILFGGWTRNRTEVSGFAIRDITTLTSSQIWSGKRDSNSRPQPWQGCALPAELFPQRGKIIHALAWFVNIQIPDAQGLPATNLAE